MDPYDFLNMSNEREQLPSAFEEHIDPYIQHLRQMLRTHKRHQYSEKTAPLVFHWAINDQQYSSTSLLFEYYMTNLLNVTQNISKTIQQGNIEKEAFKDIKQNIIHLMQILPGWTTKDFIQPNVPQVVSVDFLKQLAYFCHATQAMHLAKTTDAKNAKIALHSASHYFGKVWFRMPTFGLIALHRHMLCKGLCLQTLATEVNEDDDPEKKYMLLQEAKGLLEKVNYEHAFVDDTLKKDKAFLQEMESQLNTLRNVYYVVGTYNIEDLQTPKVLPLKVCPKLKQFNCKCNNDSVKKDENNT
jgi:hypothetical protein